MVKNHAIGPPGKARLLMNMSCVMRVLHAKLRVPVANMMKMNATSHQLFAVARSEGRGKMRYMHSAKIAT